MAGLRVTKMKEVRKYEMHLNIITLIEFATERQIRESLLKSPVFFFF